MPTWRQHTSRKALLLHVLSCSHRKRGCRSNPFTMEDMLNCCATSSVLWFPPPLLAPARISSDLHHDLIKCSLSQTSHTPHVVTTHRILNNNIAILVSTSIAFLRAPNYCTPGRTPHNSCHDTKYDFSPHKPFPVIYFQRRSIYLSFLFSQQFPLVLPSTVNHLPYAKEDADWLHILKQANDVH